MDRAKKVFAAYEGVGKLSELYDGMMSASTVVGRLALKFFWGFSTEEYFEFLSQALAGIPENFSGRLLEVPVGTGVLTLPIYKRLIEAEIFCLDYSTAMISAAETYAKKISLPNVTFIQGDVGKLSFSEKFFDVVLSVNGLHAFPDKIAAHKEIYRVLKPGGIFCGSAYITGENFVTDVFVEQFCNRMGFFTPPHETFNSFECRLKEIYSSVEISNVKSFACFKCRK